MISELFPLWESQHLWVRTLEQLQMFGAALAIVIPLGIMIGVLLYRRPGLSGMVFLALNVVETIPEIPLLVLLIPIVGIGAPAVIAACVLYSLLPLARNTHTGLSHVRKEYIETGSALGLQENEMLSIIRFPLALPLVMGGVRISVIFCMGVVTLGGLIGAGGLGAPLQTGISFQNTPLILLCTVWIAILALVADGCVGALETAISTRYGEGHG